MKNVTLSADERLIEAARQQARRRKTTLNAEFRRWLAEYSQGGVASEQRVHSYRRLMEDLSDVASGAKTFSRDELNER